MGAKSDQVKGQAKEMVGTLTGNEDLETEGKADRRAGEAKEKVGDAKEKVEEVIDTAKDKVEEAIDRTKDALHPK
ncbi:MAG: CsbD family protein [Acidimicrobiia bacterium]